MQTPNGFAYKVKVSDKDGNIITIEKDGSLYAMVGLELDENTGVLKLTDMAHSGSTLAEVEMPDADYIYNCRFDEDKKAILFDVKSLYGDETSTIELDVESLIELYEAGNGIEIGEKDETTGRRPISIKLAEGENILQVSESGLSISDAITTDDELAAAISGKADTSYVDELFNSYSGISGDISSITESIESLEDEIEKIKSVIGTEDDDPNLDERIDSKADLDEFNDLEDEVGEIETDLIKLSGDVESLKDAFDELSGCVDTFDEEIDGINDKIDYISGVVTTNSENIDELSGKVDTNTNNIAELSGEVEDNKVTVERITTGLPSNVREYYIVKNALGEQLGDEINIYQDSSLISIEFVPELQVLRFTYRDVDGTIKTIDVDLSEIIIQSEFTDGLQVNDGKVSIKIDTTGDPYLSVSEDGLKISGVAEFMAALAETDTQQWNAINATRTELEDVDRQLWNAISAETEARENADRDLSNLISNEAAARESGETSLRNYVDSKVGQEKERAELAEADLSRALSAETAARILGDNRNRDLISEEEAARIAGDNDVRQYVYDSVSPISGSIRGLRDDLAEEAAERIREDREIREELGDIRDLYAKKEYVDAKDAEWVITAVTSATTLANQYSDLKNDYLEAELKLYCDTGHTELQRAISDNATKINVISNLKGVSGSDASNYDNTGNGILDVLHREFHEMKGTIAPLARGAQIRNVDEVAFGRYNVSNKETDQMTGADVTSGCTIFSIGIGTSDEQRRNAFEVRQDGSVYLWVEGEYMCINNILAMLTHETY